MIELWRARRARKAALRVLAPLVAGTRFRLGVIPDRTWSDPYIVGFLAMLITRVAQQRVGVLGPETLGLVQSEAFAALSGVSTDAIGQRILALSSGEDRIFEHGCNNGFMFAAAMESIDLPSSIAGDVDPQMHLSPGPGEIVELWISNFDRYLSAP